ncbi:aldehyde dehydrogenase family protein [Luteolibacter algae]|uniref:Aldehyde dehydrogenase family protein n=1 Tax=Luteolibacter algae TaxID=454151 RepID=A0ABW5D4S9_9BACT
MSLKSHFKTLVPGASSSAGSLEVTAPFDGSVIGSVELADAAAVEQALDIAAALHADVSQRLPAWQRISILKKAAGLLTERAEDFALESAREGGKPLIDSRAEVSRAIDGIHCCIETIRTQHGEEIPMGLNPASAHRLAFSSHEPIGPVLAYSAFNHPMNLIIHQVFPAIATGCPVIVKPASDTPLSCFRLVELLHEAGLPPAWCQALAIKDRGLATATVGDRRIAFFTFIGSGKVGWMLRSKLAPGTRCALEHGGAAPVIMDDTADLNLAAPLLAKGAFYHAGQVCVSVQRIFAPSTMIRELADKLAAEAARMKVGDPTLEEVAIGPLIRTKELERVEKWVEEAIAAGAKLHSGGKRFSSTCYGPTILIDPPPACSVSSEEIFGPVVCLYSYEDLEEAIDRANHVPYSFQASVFSQNMDTIFRAYRRLNAKTVMVNDHTAFRVDWMPFAGLRESGLGIGGIPHTISDMQIEKSLIFQSPSL